MIAARALREHDASAAARWERFRGWSSVVRCVLIQLQCGPVAQRLEQGTHNPLVPGSNPGGPSFISEFIFAAQGSESNFALKILFGRIVAGALIALEIAILSALILATRCANYQDVFVAGNVYFTDADCYARMTRVRMCAKNPGLVIRRHNFENFPRGTTPHTTAPLDYLIVALAITLKPFTTRGIDLAGALISPMFALLGGWFLWWWAWRMKFRYRWMMLSLYAISPILVHGTELGRPDHQSLLLLLVTIAICAEWSLRSESAPGWSTLSGIAWGLAIWVSAYEPLVLFGIVVAVSLVQDQQVFLAKSRRTGWISFALIIAVAALIERRIPSMSIFSSNEIFNNWARTVGELAHVSPLNPIWFRWTGYMIVVAPLLIWFSIRKRNGSGLGQGTTPLIIVLLVASYFLTIWQARWAYFFVSIFAIALPSLLDPIKSRAAVWIAFVMSIFPILRGWDARLWPNEMEYARRIEQRNESVQLRELSINLLSSEVRSFLAPWWLSPSIAYWSGQPAVAGSSHESLSGIADSADFFLTEDWPRARGILENHKVIWVIAYDFERVSLNSSAIMGRAVSRYSLCYVLDRTPAQVPRFLVFSAQNGGGKLYRTALGR